MEILSNSVALSDATSPLSHFQRRQQNGSSEGGNNTNTNPLPNGTTASAPQSPSPTEQQSQNPTGAGGTPLSVFTFVIAVALFALVISFVLFRTWRSRRRGAHFIGYDHTEGFARLLGIGSNIEDSSVPPKLWEARFVPYSDKPQVQTGNRSVWNNLMPVAASLPVSLYMQLGAADGAFNDKAKTESRTHSTPSNANNPASAAVPTVGANEHDNDGDENEEKKDLDEVMPGSVNISVLIAMPEPPKRKDALPELMLGTAAVPIYSSQRHDDTTMSSSLRTSTTATVSAGVARMTDVRYFPPTTVSAQATAPTRAQLLALVAAARQAKDRQCKLRNNEKQRSQERSCSGNEQQSPQSSGSPRRS